MLSRGRSHRDAQRRRDDPLGRHDFARLEAGHPGLGPAGPSREPRHRVEVVHAPAGLDARRPQACPHQRRGPAAAVLTASVLRTVALRARGHAARGRRRRRSGAAPRRARRPARAEAASATMATYDAGPDPAQHLLRRIREDVATRTSCPTGTACSSARAGGSCAGGARRSRLSPTPLAEAHARDRARRGPRSRRATSPTPRRGRRRGRRRGAAPPAARDGREGALERRDARGPASGRCRLRAATVATSPASRRGASSARAILALKLAQLDVLTALDGRPPLLLLDDVFSELDPDRRSHLVRRIGGAPPGLRDHHRRWTTWTRRSSRARRLAIAPGMRPERPRPPSPASGRCGGERMSRQAPAVPPRRGPPAGRRVAARARGGAPAGSRGGHLAAPRRGAGAAGSRRHATDGDPAAQLIVSADDAGVAARSCGCTPRRCSRRSRSRPEGRGSRELRAGRRCVAQRGSGIGRPR